MHAAQWPVGGFCHPSCFWRKSTASTNFWIRLIAFTGLNLSTCLPTATSVESSIYISPVYDSDIDNGAYGAYPTHTFHTTNLQAPFVNFAHWSRACSASSSHYFLSPKGHKISSPGPMILDMNGELIWTDHFANGFGGQAYNLRVQDWQGQKVLTFWLGDDRIRGHGAGQWFMVCD